MALDALAVKCLVKEFKNTIINGRIDKIHQPEKDEIVLNIRTYNSSYSLVISAGSANPRIHFTTLKKANPITAPLFCMMLRKHIGSGKIVNVSQIDFERIIRFDIESYDDFGDACQKHLIVELMGRHSNIILCYDDSKIIDSIKHIDLSISSKRQVLPGLIYNKPPIQDKTDLTDISSDFILDLTAPTLSRSIMNTISGISPLTAREIVYSVYNTADLNINEAKNINALYSSIIEFAKKINNEDFNPCLIVDSNTHEPIEFSSIEIHQYENLYSVEYIDSISEILDKYYSGRDSADRMKQKSASLVKLLNMYLDRASKKQIILTNTLKDAEKKESYKINGDLLMANLYSINDGERLAKVQNFYDPDCAEKIITLDPHLSVTQNAQRFYKKYQKSKTAEIEATIQLKNNQEVLDYLESTLFNVSNCQNEADLSAIRAELSNEGYIKKISSKKNKQTQSKPMHFVSKDGFDIYVGKNNTQNDYLTLKFANSQDLWFHTKNIHGSHTIIKLGVNKDVPTSTILEAAAFAAFYSKGKNSNQVPVDYTFVKNVKKPNGAKPGMVIYDYYNTVYVTPKNPNE